MTLERNLSDRKEATTLGAEVKDRSIGDGRRAKTEEDEITEKEEEEEKVEEEQRDGLRLASLTVRMPKEEEEEDNDGADRGVTPAG